MHVDRKFIINSARVTQFQPDIIEKAYRLTLLLEEIRKHPVLNNDLVLKGGTAINFLYLPLPRLSVDLDFNFIGAVTKEESDLKREDIKRHLQSVFSFLKYDVSEREEYGIHQYFLRYTNSASNKDTIKVEVNYLMRISLLPIEEKEIRLPFFENINLKVRVLALEELYGGKIAALLTRCAARDLFDVYALLQEKIKFSKPILKKIVIFFGSMDREDLRNVSANLLSRVSQRDIKTDLLPLLRKNAVPSREKMIKKIEPLLVYVLTFSKGQQEYLNDLLKGEYRPELLFREKQVSDLDSLQNHPMALWKQQHIREWLKR